MDDEALARWLADATAWLGRRNDPRSREMASIAADLGVLLEVVDAIEAGEVVDHDDVVERLQTDEIRERYREWWSASGRGGRVCSREIP